VLFPLFDRQAVPHTEIPQRQTEHKSHSTYTAKVHRRSRPTLLEPLDQPQLVLSNFQTMILELEHWYLGYEQILNDCRTTGEDGAPGTVFLLCNTDVDAMSCARILSYMLRSDGIHYQLLPCTSYSTLDRYLLSTPLQDVRAVVLLNFGASKNLTTFFDQNEKLNDAVKIYVMDCRRPVHLANIHAGENVVVFWDQTQSNDYPSDGDNLSGNDSSSSESSSSSDDDDESHSDNDDTEAKFGGDSDEGEVEAGFDDVVRGEAAPEVPDFQKNDDELDQGTDYDGEDERDDRGSGPSYRPRDEKDDGSSTQQLKRRKTSNTSDGALPATDGEGVTDAEHSVHSDSSGREHGEDEAPSKNERELSPRELHRQRRDRLHGYYTSGSFYGSPIAYVAYRLANQMRFGENGDLLWLACVGATDAYLHSRLDVVGYHALVLDLRRLCLRLFPNDMYQRAMNAVFAEDLTGDLTRHGEGGRQGTNDRTKITFSENGRIISEKDYRFFLLRHSSLFDSMAHSDYVSTRLQVWTKKGLHKLQELLAKMGYPLEECHQPFAFMKPSLKRRLQEKIVLHAAVSSVTEFHFAVYCLKTFPTYSTFLLFLFSGIWLGEL
jgi:cell division control protein 45